MNKPSIPKGQLPRHDRVDYLLCIKDLYEGADPNSELWNKKGEKYKVIGETEDDYIIMDSDKRGDIHHIPKGDFFEEYFVLNGKVWSEGSSILNSDGEIDENIFSRVRAGGFTIEDIYLSGDRKPHKVKRLFTDYAMDKVGFMYNYNDIEEVVKICEGMPECIQYLVDNNLIEIKYKTYEEIKNKEQEQKKNPLKPFIFDLFIESEAMLDDFSIWMRDRDMI